MSLGARFWDHRRMIVKLHTQRLQTLAEVRAFLQGSTPLDFDVPAREDAYRWIESSLRQLRYRSLGRSDKLIWKPRPGLPFTSSSIANVPICGDTVFTASVGRENPSDEKIRTKIAALFRVFIQDSCQPCPIPKPVKPAVPSA